MDCLEQVSVGTTGLQHKLLVKKLKNRGRPSLLYHVYRVLVVLEWDTLPLNTFLFILLLLQSEHVLVELLLQLLIGVVNTELFKGVLCKDLKSEDIQDADKCQLTLLAFLGAGRLGFCTTGVQRD